MLTQFDRWLIFEGNPEEWTPEVTWCHYCHRSHHREDNEYLCPTCARAGVFRCEGCMEWLPRRLKAPPAPGQDDLCFACVDRLR